MADGVHPDDDGYQFWVSTGPDPDGSRLALALYGASRTARSQGHPVELVTRGPEGLRVWTFDPDGTLTGPPTDRASTGEATPGTGDGTAPDTDSTTSGSTTGVAALDQAWADFERVAADFDRAEFDHSAALVDEALQRELRIDAQDSLDRAVTALTNAAAEAHRTHTAATTAEQRADQAEQHLGDLTGREKTLIGGISAGRRGVGTLTDAVADGQRAELSLSSQAKTARRNLADLYARAAAASTTRTPAARRTRRHPARPPRRTRRRRTRPPRTPARRTLPWNRRSETAPPGPPLPPPLTRPSPSRSIKSPPR